MADGSDVAFHAPRADQFFRTIGARLRERAVRATPEDVCNYLQAKKDRGEFDNFHRQFISITFGDNNPVSVAFRQVFKEFGDVMRYLLLDTNTPLNQTLEIVNGFKYDIDHVPLLTVTYCVMFARKVSA